MRITPIPDRSAEQPAEPCARHTVAVMFIVRAEVCEGTTAAHLIEYVSAHLGNREPDLHEDIFDELESVTMDVDGQEVSDTNSLVMSNAIMEAAINVYQGGEVCDFMESMSLVDEARQHVANDVAQAEEIKRLREAARKLGCTTCFYKFQSDDMEPCASRLPSSCIGWRHEADGAPQEVPS